MPPRDGDTIIIPSGVTVTIDVNIGTPGAGIRNIRIQGGTLRVDGSAHTIVFGSTGTDPIGNGTEGSPGATASMFGIAVSNRGTLDLEATAAAPLAITTQNDFSPTYIRGAWGDDGYNEASSIILKHVDARHLGVNTGNFTGIFLDMRVNTPFAPVLDVEYCRFSDFYAGSWNAVFQSSAPVTVRNNYFTGVRSAYTWSSSNPVGGPDIFTDNTEDNPRVNGYFLELLRETNNLDFERNVGVGTPAAKVAPLYITDPDTPNTIGATIRNNMFLNPYAFASPVDDGFRLENDPGATMSVVDGNVMMGFGASFANYRGQIEYKNNVSLNFALGAPQGAIELYDGSGPVHYNMLAILPENASSTAQEICIFAYKFRNDTQLHADHNTCIGQTAGDGGIQAGENGFESYHNYVTSNLVVTEGYGIVSDVTAADAWDVAGHGFAGAAVHHNDVFGARVTPYYKQNLPATGFDNGLVEHPSTSYGDITADPMFYDATRRPSTWDASLGGPGTYSDIARQFSFRSGFGGTYNPSFSVPAALSYLQLGFSPTNGALKGAAADHGDIGAVPVYVGITSVPTLKSITCNPGSISGAGSSACTVTLSGPATAAMAVGLSSSTSAVRVPASVTVAFGSAVASFTATSNGSTNGTATLTATLAGVQANFNLTLTAAAPALSGLTCAPAVIVGAGSSTCTVTLSGNAAVATTVTLSSNSTALVTPPGVTIPAGAASAQFSAVSSGANTVAAVAAVLGGVSKTFILTLTSSTFNLRVHAGGAQYRDPQGYTWSADIGYSGGNVWSTTYPIAGTNADSLYQTVRWGNFGYQFSAPNGQYTVNLKFAEISLTSVGQRDFSVTINGATVLQDFDIVAAAQGPLVAVDRAFPATVTNGTIAIGFVAGSQDWPMLSGIEIVPQGAPLSATGTPPPTSFSPVRINSGGAAVQDPQGNLWAADIDFLSGATWSTTESIGNTTTPQLYQSCRYGDFFYQAPLPNGKYDVTLKFAELSRTSPGQRVFNVQIDGSPVLTNFDIIASAGGALAAVDRTFPVTVTNGVLTLGFTQGPADLPLINAIQVVLAP